MLGFTASHTASASDSKTVVILIPLAIYLFYLLVLATLSIELLINYWAFALVLPIDFVIREFAAYPCESTFLNLTPCNLQCLSLSPL